MIVKELVLSDNVSYIKDKKCSYAMSAITFLVTHVLVIIKVSDKKSITFLKAFKIKASKIRKKAIF